MSWIHAGKSFSSSNPLLVGVINLSPESFFKGSIAAADNQVENKVKEFNEYTVDCIDVGAMSTRPIEIYGGERASLKQEKDRVKEFLPNLMDIASSYEIPVSIDTQYSEVASVAVDLGVSVINDISGLKKDKEMASLVASSDLDLVIMATGIEPDDVCGIDQTMQALSESLDLARDDGIKNSKIAIDPGFGGWQGRSKSCDLELLREFDRFKSFNLPIYIGVSRKSTVGTLGGGEAPADRLPGSIELTSWLIDKGASIIRTHDVKETRLALNVKQTLLSL